MAFDTTLMIRMWAKELTIQNTKVAGTHIDALEGKIIHMNACMRYMVKGFILDGILWVTFFFSLASQRIILPAPGLCNEYNPRDRQNGKGMVEI